MRDLLDLTPKQFDALVKFMELVEAHGRAPSLRELGDALDLKYTTIRTRVRYLVEKGYLKDAGVHRGLSVTPKVELLA